ncbi:hypothetical protein GGI04_003718 [Coemansia thaxteri]|nr:hypothetical protein GGI04_003718 [Coemansia thaxteri]
MSNARESTPALNRIWLRLIGTLCVYMHTSKMASEACMSDATSGADAAADRRHGHLGVLGEMAEESTKNCMLVLESMGIFGNVGDGQKGASALWQQSWDQLDKASPQLRERIFPPVKTLELTAPTGQPTDAAPSGAAVVNTASQPESAEVDNALISGVADLSIQTLDHTGTGPPVQPQQQPQQQQPTKKKHSKQSIIIVT